MVEVRMSMKCDRCGRVEEFSIPLGEEREVSTIVNLQMKNLGFTAYNGGVSGLPKKTSKVLCERCKREFVKKCEELALKFMGGER